MIARMDKLFMLASKRLAPKILLRLQQAGVVQVDPLPENELGAYPLEPVQETRLKRWEAVALATEHAAGLLGLEFDARVDPYQGDLQNAEATALSYERQAARLVERREQLIDELQLVEQYSEVLEYLAGAVHGLDDSPRLSVIPVLVRRHEDLAVAKRELASKLEDAFSPH